METIIAPIPGIQTINPVQLNSLCIDFHKSHYYQKAIQDANYSRLEGVEDFLSEQNEVRGLSLDEEERSALALSILKNYYRFF